MRRLSLILPVVALLAVFGLSPQARAQDTKKVTGTLTAMSGDSITVKVGTSEMNFTVDDKVHVEAPGAGTKSRQAAAANTKPKLNELLHTGDPVEVSYSESGGAKHASMLRKVPSAGSAGVPANTANGTVTAVSATSLTISGSGGGGSTFTQTYVITPDTKVIGKGASTASTKAGGKLAITELVGNGDHVAVSFKPDGSSLNATEVRVTNKAGAKTR